MDWLLCSVCSDERCKLKNMFIESVYIVEDDVFDQMVKRQNLLLCNFHSKTFIGVPSEMQNTQMFNRHQIKRCCNFMGCKASDAQKIIGCIFSGLSDELKSKTEIRESETFSNIRALTLKKSRFDELASDALVRTGYNIEFQIRDFQIASNIESRRNSITVLLGGTSGTGKSTLSSLIASRLGISTVLSTDSIRHIMRNFLDKDKNAILFASTYEAYKFIKEEGLSQKQAAIQGYMQQCEMVYEHLVNLIRTFHEARESVVIEGVHLAVPIIKRLMESYPSCIPFIIYIKNKNKHSERFAVRSKYMTLDPAVNKYIAHFSNIRAIQKKMLDQADRVLIPKVENSNVDRSLGLIHAALLRCLRRLDRGEQIYDAVRKQTIPLHEEYNNVAKNIWSSKAAQKFINTKTSKGELFKRLFQDERLYHVEEVQEVKLVSRSVIEGRSAHEEVIDDNQEIGSLVSGSIGLEVIQQKLARVGSGGSRGSQDGVESEDSVRAHSPSTYSESSAHSIQEESGPFIPDLCNISNKTENEPVLPGPHRIDKGRSLGRQASF